MLEMLKGVITLFQLTTLNGRFNFWDSAVLNKSDYIKRLITQFHQTLNKTSEITSEIKFKKISEIIKV
jgi:hypothetical protein